MDFTESRRLYQQLASELKSRIETGSYPVGDKLPAERLIAEEMEVSRTVVREAIIMLEVEGYVEVRKGSGIHVIASQQQNRIASTSSQLEFATFGPFELLQARRFRKKPARRITSATPSGICSFMYVSRNPPRTVP